MVTTDTTTTTSTTSSVATYTVPTPAGFTPLASEPGYVPKKRSVEVPAIRGRTVEERAAVQKPVCPQVGKPGSFSQYPQIVTCGALVVAKTTSTRTYTATSTITTTLPVSTSTTTVSNIDYCSGSMVPQIGKESYNNFHSLPPLRPR